MRMELIDRQSLYVLFSVNDELVLCDMYFFLAVTVENLSMVLIVLLNNILLKFACPPPLDQIVRNLLLHGPQISVVFLSAM